MPVATAQPLERPRFIFERCLGVGGFGEVYLARTTTGGGLQRQVAVKLLQGGLDPNSVMRLRDEARLLAALNHAAILQVHDLIELEGRPALVTEYVDGEDLAQLIRDAEAVPVRAAIEIVGEVAGALNAGLTTVVPGSTRPLGLVHRDIKPANIRVARSGTVKLLDFGIAVSSEVEREAKTGTGLIVGTLGFLAPERVSEEGVKPPSDIYALGCVLYELLVDERLFKGVNQGQLLRIALSEQEHDTFLEQRLLSIPPTVSTAVRELLRSLLAYDAARRPSAGKLEKLCDQLASDAAGPGIRRWARERHWSEPAPVRGMLDGRTIEASGTLSGRPSGVPAPPSPPRTTSALPRLIPLAVGGLAIAGVAVSIAAVVGWGLFYRSEPPPVPVAETPAVIAAPPAALPVAAANLSPSPAPVETSAPATPAAQPKRTAALASPTRTPAATATATAPAREAVVSANGMVVVKGTVPVELRGGGRSFKGGQAPTGSYEVWADFGSGLVKTGNAQVADGATTTIQCSLIVLSCKVSGP